MKLTGNVSQTRDTVAKVVDGKIEIKRGYTINIRPSSGSPQGYEYGYGSMSFITHGSELSFFGVALGDDVECFLVKKGQPVPNRDFEEVSATLYKTEAALTALTNSSAGARKDLDRAQETVREGTRRMTALQNENVRLTTELETLKAVLATRGDPINLRQIGPAGSPI